MSMIGKTLGHYEITSQLGKGGMGEVYQATDLKLGRDVALKVLPEEFARDADRVARFQREAKLLASLNHPNVAAIYGLDESGGTKFLVLELVTGETLAEQIKRGPLLIEESLKLALQITEGLEAAHAKGIIHRDLKPANIKVTPDGKVKVLDLGLAREMREQVVAASDGSTESQLTEAGQLLGTVSYMSPEQALGKAVDQRSDIFSFGVVLYEMIAGRHPFQGENTIAILDAIIHRDPPSIARYKDRVPDELLRILRKMLEKDCSLRYQSVHEVWSDLKRFRGDSAGESPDAGRQLLERPWTLRRMAAWLRGLLQAGASPSIRNHRRLVAAVTVLFGVIALMLSVQYWAARPYRPRTDAVRWFEEGLNAMRDGTYLKASKVLSEAVRLDPDFVLARARLAEAWLEMDYPERAKDELLLARRRESMLRRLPKGERLQFEAIESLITGETLQGIQSYRRLVEVAEPVARPAIWLDLGRACERAADFKCALEAYQQATQVDPQIAAGWLRLALIHRRARRYDEAAAAFDRAEHLFQTASNIEGGTEVQYGRGMMFVDREQFEAAAKVLRGALASSRVAANIQQQVKILMQLATVSLRTADSAAVVKLSREAIDLARANGVEILAARALITLGSGWLIKDPNEAEQYYREAFEIAQRNKSPFVEARARLALASLYDTKGLPARCLAEARLASEFFRRAGYNRETFQATVLLGRSQLHLGNLDEAARTFQSMLEASGPGGPREEQAILYEGLGNVYFVQERYRAAHDSFTRSYEASMTGNNAFVAGHSLLYQAACLWRLGDYNHGPSPTC